MQKIQVISKDQFSRIKNFAKELLKNKFFYIYLVLVGMIISAIFSKWFVLPVAIIAIVFTIIFDETKSLSMLLFLYSFYSIFIFKSKNLFVVLYMLCFMVLLIKRLIYIKKNNLKLDFMFLLFLSVFLLYVSLPIHGGKDMFAGNLNIYNIAFIFMAIISVYLVCMHDKKVDCLTLFRFAVLGFILAGLIGILKVSIGGAISGHFYETTQVLGYSGMFYGSNQLGIVGTIFIAGTLYLIYENKLKTEGYIYFLFVFAITYCSLTRASLYCIIIGIVLFIVFSAIRYKGECYKYIVPLLSLVLAVVFILFPYTKAHIDRASILDIYKGYGNTASLSLNELKEVEDPGRGGLYKKYFLDYISDIFVVFFGRGFIYPPFEGQLSSHNTFLQAFWSTGAIGVVVLVALVLFMLCRFTNLKLKEILKRIFCTMGLYLVLITVSALFFVEDVFFGVDFIFILMLIEIPIIINFRKNKNEESSN